MIYVTHDQVEAMTMADKIVVLNAGSIEQVGSPLELYNKPDNLFVAGFIGSPQDELRRRARRRKKLGARDHRHPAGAYRRVARARRRGRARCAIAEHLGSDTFLMSTSTGVGRITARAPGEFALAAGDKVWLTPKPERIHRFDADGQAVRRADLGPSGQQHVSGEVEA